MLELLEQFERERHSLDPLMSIMNIRGSLFLTFKRLKHSSCSSPSIHMTHHPSPMTHLLILSNYLLDKLFILYKYVVYQEGFAKAG